MGRVLSSFRKTLCFATASLAVSAAACSSSDELRPAAGPADQARRAPMTASDGGVQMSAAVGAWRGEPEALRYSMPVYVSITNYSGQPIRVEPSAFQLSAPNGQTYASMTANDLGFRIQKGVPGFPETGESAEESRASDVYLQALYAGVIREGETRDGFVFFEGMSRREGDLKLTVQFESMNTGETAAKIALPISSQGE